MRTIQVTGKGLLILKPDTTRITMTLTGLYGDYAETLRRSSEKTETLRELFARFGFERTELKTIGFDVETEYESYRDKDGDYRQRFAGYRFNHTAKLEFPSDDERLGRILYALSNSPAEAEFRISYTVKDPEAAKTLLLEKAVADAKAKAEVLTRAGGAALGQIKSIDYSRVEIDFECRPMNRTLMAKADCAVAGEGSYALGIEPDDIEVSDTVTIVWEIE